MVDVQTLKFKAIVLVRSFSTPLVRQPKEFVISSSDEFEDVDLASDDVIFNIVTADTALKCKDGDKFWRGPKEKALSLLWLLISGLNPPGGIICDLTAGTGMSDLFNLSWSLDLGNSITFNQFICFSFLLVPRFLQHNLLIGQLWHLRVTCTTKFFSHFK
jgi:hypothetical protein